MPSTPWLADSGPGKKKLASWRCWRRVGCAIVGTFAAIVLKCRRQLYACYYPHFLDITRAIPPHGTDATLPPMQSPSYLPDASGAL